MTFGLVRLWEVLYDLVMIAVKHRTTWGLPESSGYPQAEPSIRGSWAVLVSGVGSQDNYH